MAERDEPADAADDLDRIEAALDRIAANRRPAAAAAIAGENADAGVGADTTMIAERLDGLIARLREALAFATG